MKKSIALIIILGIFVTATIYALITLALSSSTHKKINQHIKFIKAQSFANAGLAKAIYKSGAGNYTNETFSYPLAVSSIPIHIDSNGYGTYNVTIDASYQDVPVRLEAGIKGTDLTAYRIQKQ